MENGSSILLETGEYLLLETGVDTLLLEGFRITIAGTDRTGFIDRESISVEQVLTKQSDQFSFKIKNYGTKTFQPAIGDVVVFSYNNTKIFAGNIMELNETTEGLARELKVQVKDYSNLLDSQLVSKTYGTQSDYELLMETGEYLLSENGIDYILLESSLQIYTVNAIIQDILNTFTDGSFTMNNVSANVSINNVVFNYISVSECFKKLVALLPNYDWYVDYDKDIHFQQNGLIASPYNLTDTSGNYLYNSLEIVSDYSKLANEIIIRGGKVTGTATRTEYLSGDGTRTNFPLGNDFVNIPLVTVGGLGIAVGLDGQVPDAGYAAMWNSNSQLLRFTSGNTPTAGTNNIVVTGTPQFPLLYIKQSQSSITTYGRKQKIIDDKSINDLTTASQRADSELLAYSTPINTASFSTYVDGLVVGQYINVSSAIRNINQSYKIQQVRCFCRTNEGLRYDVELQSSNDIGINDVLAKLLIQNPADQNIPNSSTVIQRIYDFNETLAITDNIGTPVTASGPYVWDTPKWGFFTWS